MQGPQGKLTLKDIRVMFSGFFQTLEGERSRSPRPAPAGAGRADTRWRGGPQARLGARTRRPCPVGAGADAPWPCWRPHLCPLAAREPQGPAPVSQPPALAPAQVLEWSPSGGGVASGGCGLEKTSVPGEPALLRLSAHQKQRGNLTTGPPGIEFRGWGGDTGAAISS